MMLALHARQGSPTTRRWDWAAPASGSQRCRWAMFCSHVAAEARDTAGGHASTDTWSLACASMPSSARRGLQLDAGTASASPRLGSFGDQAMATDAADEIELRIEMVGQCAATLPGTQHARSHRRPAPSCPSGATTARICCTPASVNGVARRAWKAGGTPVAPKHGDHAHAWFAPRGSALSG